jgi:hypothetical protein
MTPDPADEARHVAPDDRSWREAWWFDAWLPDGSLAVCCCLTLLPAAGQAWYWCQVAREDVPLLHVADLDGLVPLQGLTIRWHALWAEHVCEAPFAQWTVANETYAVALDDPQDALGRAYGRAEPLALDLEWYASTGPAEVAHGYEQDGEVHGVIELRGGPLEFVGQSRRGHWWGQWRWPHASSAPPAGLRAPVALPDGVLEQVATGSGWVRWLRE